MKRVLALALLILLVVVGGVALRRGRHPVTLALGDEADTDALAPPAQRRLTTTLGAEQDLGSEEAPADDEDQRVWLNPDEVTEAGSLSVDGYGHPLKYTLRIARSVVPPRSPVEARLMVRSPTNIPVKVAVESVQINSVATGYLEPGGSFNTVDEADAQIITWTPSDLSLGSGVREFIVTVALGGKSHVVSAPFSFAWPPPVRPGTAVAVVVRDGYLRAQVPMEAKGKWACQLSANLHDARGRLLQHATWMGPVESGTGVPLEFSLAAAGTPGRKASYTIGQFAGACRSTFGDVDEDATARILTVEQLHTFDLDD